MTQARGTIKCFYEKLQRVEPVAMRALVRSTAERVTELRVKGGYPPAAAEPIPGYRLLSIDGNHLEATEKRLEDQVGAALPGQVLAVLEHNSGLVLEVLPWEDAHANEKEVLTTQRKPGASNFVESQFGKKPDAAKPILAELVKRFEYAISLEE